MSATKSGSLNLDDGPATRCWLITKARLEQDTALRASGVTLQFWDGHPDSVTRLADVQSPTLRFYPGVGPAQWWDEGRLQAQLAVTVEAVLFRLDPLDAMNLTHALIRALYPSDNWSYQSALVAAGAATGQWAVPRGLSQPQVSAIQENLYRLTGQITLAVVTELLPS